VQPDLQGNQDFKDLREILVKLGSLVKLDLKETEEWTE
jgi:hypothetical protein